MPRPDVLDRPDWPSVFATAMDLDSWLATAEDDEQRRRLDEQIAAFRPDPLVAAAVGALPRPVRVLAIAEAWCPDVARHLPVLAGLLDLRADCELRLLHRRDRPELLPRYLTNGGEAVPKFVFFTDAHVECGSWGPMPRDCARIIAQGRACGDQRTARALVARLSSADPRRLQVQHELLELLRVAATTGLTAPAD